MTSTPPDEPTRWMPPTAAGSGDEPTRAIPVPPPAAAPPGAPPVGPPLDPPVYGGPPPGEPPGNPNRTIAWVALGLAVVLVILIALLLGFRHKSKGSSTTTTTTTSSSTTLAPTTTRPSTTTSTSTTSTTVRATTTSPPTTVAAATGNRPPTASEQKQILADVGDSHPGYQVSVLRIANSDNSWAALKYEGAPTQQPFQEVRHLTGGHWQAVATGTAQVDCDPSVPPQVQKDFANVLGSC